MLYGYENMYVYVVCMVALHATWHLLQQCDTIVA